MSDYHVLRMDRKIDSAQVVFHFLVPVGNNFANRSYRDVLKADLEKTSRTGVIESQYPFIDGVELGAMQNGEIYEYVANVKFDATLNNAEKRSLMDEEWTRLRPIVLNGLAEVYDFYGYDRDVP